ncbi:hypothetical protein BCV72DRAFT_272427 [Rhizopus microsporus var. microsporus]|uniref:Uncharacterized protein n=2 Tax=Rhizopus microsporus TaxID=58291 RepID=A0A2G4SUZ1_RHIZD|nr:uncharacterized protein RHIMIDRAFT_313336 [Rhizopus microsporus ATCC 52813]ORE08062.1 hypothetical protein BCV72DRAFT_272427 [Rhizopus microsporus var. microsporus]PHZ12562.1 hypothetical protein RHIMIDRAFT_313336 [Rhizopus microsporus ATCC 52813]
MWIDTSLQNQGYHLHKEQVLSVDKLQLYNEDDDTTTDNGKTLSSVVTMADNISHDSPLYEEEESLATFEKIMKDPENSRISKYRNTYFMDGGSRFISLPTLGNTSTKAASHISRVFEDWLQYKLYHQNYDERLPILEDSVELIAEDIVNKLKSRNSVRGLAGLARIFIQIRTGHIYTYHPLEDGQPLITADMEDFFQQFPLFVEIIIYTMPREDQSIEDVQLLLTVENITINPSEPYQIKQDIQLVA